MNSIHPFKCYHVYLALLILLNVGAVIYQELKC